MTEYVLGFAFTNDYAGFDRVLLIRKTKPVWQAGRLNGIGGKLEAGETPHRAMAREFSEECGLDSLPGAWLLFAEMIFDDCVVYCFSTWWGWKQFKQARSTTEEEICSFELDEKFFEKLEAAPAIPNLHWLIPAGRAAWKNSSIPVLEIKESKTRLFHDPKIP